MRAYLQARLSELGLAGNVDAKGNLEVRFGKGRPRVVVTAHMDEIAMIVRGLEWDGSLRVGPLGGMDPWKVGEGPVSILTSSGPVNGVLAFGGIHTADPASTVEQAEAGPLKWEMARVLTGLGSADDVAAMGIRPGTRVVLAEDRRKLWSVGDLVSGPFLDDRADLVSWLLALEGLKGFEGEVAFLASASEEVGGEGALYYLHGHRPEVCIALELGPNVSDAPVEISDQPTVWATDSFATMTASDGDLLANLGLDLGMDLQFQALSRGGSDASCAASHGLCARPITLGLPMENSHGFEMIHPGSMDNLAGLTAALVKRLLN